MKAIKMFSIIFLLLGVSFLGAQQTVVIASGEWAPFSGGELKEGGFVCDVTTQVFKRAGYDVKISYYPWERAGSMAEAGQVDASAYWYVSDEKKAHSYFSDPLTSEKTLFFRLKSKPHITWNKLSDLAGYKIGVTRGVTYPKEFWDMVNSGQLSADIANDDLTNFKKLEAGRIDIFPCGDLVGYQIIREKFPQLKDMVVALDKPLAEETGHLIFPKNRPGSKALLDAFNKALSQFKKEGLFDAYQKKLLEGYYSAK